MYDELSSTLECSALFRGIGTEALAAMLECMRPRVRQYKPREVIAVCAQSFDGIGVVASGSVSLSKETYSGNRIILAVLNAGEIFGEVVAFSDSKVWPVTVIAQQDSRLLLLPPEKILGNYANTCASQSILIMNMLKHTVKPGIDA